MNNQIEVVKNIKVDTQTINSLDFQKEFIRKFYKSYNKDDFDLLFKEANMKHVINELLFENNLDPKEAKGLAEVYSKIYEYDYKQQREDGQPIYNLYSLVDLHKTIYKYTDHPEFGGQFRQRNVFLPNTNIEVPSFDVAMTELNKLHEPFKELAANSSKMDIIDYIDQSVKMVTKIMAIQPFNDGNKRSCRALLTLMLRKENIPPFSFSPLEKEEYSIALRKAMEEENFDKLNNIVYTKIADSIYDFDIYKNINNKSKSIAMQTLKEVFKSNDVPVIEREEVENPSKKAK